MKIKIAIISFLLSLPYCVDRNYGQGEEGVSPYKKIPLFIIDNEKSLAKFDFPSGALVMADCLGSAHSVVSVKQMTSSAFYETYENNSPIKFFIIADHLKNQFFERVKKKKFDFPTGARERGAFIVIDRSGEMRLVDQGKGSFEFPGDNIPDELTKLKESYADASAGK